MRDMLASVAAVFRAELVRHVYAARTYVVLAGMALATSACVFLVGGLVDSDFASLDLLFVFLPLVAICTVPALGARAFAAEDSGREVELLLSLPLTDGEMVLGKWLAGCAALLVGLALTAPIAATVAYLGNPDWGTAASGLAGAVLLLAAFYAVALLASAIAAQQTTAYLLAIVLLLSLCATGSDALSSVVTLPVPVTDVLRLINPRLALERLATGRIEAATVFALLALTATALFLTKFAIGWRRSGTVEISRAIGLLASLFGISAAATALGGLILSPFGALDATRERLYSFSPATVDIARSAAPGTVIDFYWTTGEPTVPAHIRDHARQVRQTLELLARRSAGKLTLRQHDAMADSEADWQAVASGLRRVPLATGGSFVLGAVLRHAERRHVIDYFDVERAGSAEYDLALALSRLGRQRIPKVGILSPLLAPSELQEPASRFAFLEALRAANDVAVIPFFADAPPDDLDVLLLIGEAPMKPTMLRAIDRHVMRGKSVVALLDPLTRLDKTGRMVSRSAGSDLATVSDLIARYGMSFDASVVGDAENAALVASASGRPTPYPFFIAATQGRIAAAHPAASRIRRLLFLEPGSFVLAPGTEPLVTTSSNAGAAPASVLATSPSENATALTVDGKRRVLAAVATGALETAFRDSARECFRKKCEAVFPIEARQNEELGSGRDSTKSGKTLEPSAPDRAMRSARAVVIAVADVDWILDGAALAGTETGLGGGDNDNLVFLANLIELAGGDHRLMSISSRTPQGRRFTRIAAMMSAMQARYQTEDSASRAVIEKVENTVAEILKATKARSVADLPAEVRTRIGALYAETIPARKRQREIRLAMRHAIEQMSFRLTALNLVFGPFAALLLWVLARAARPRWSLGKAHLDSPARDARS